MALSYFNQVIGGVSQLWVTDGTALGTHIVARSESTQSLILRRSAAGSPCSIPPTTGKSSGLRTGPPPEQ